MAEAGSIIVYVDDDLDDQQLLRDAFSSVSNHELLILPNGDELFNYLKTGKKPICLLVLDINLPGRDGIEILQQLKTLPHLSSIPVVMFTTGVNYLQAMELKRIGVEV